MAYSQQYGGGWMGGISLQANGSNPQNFRNISPGPVSRFLLEIDVSLKSSAAAFALVVDTGQSAAGEGVDDLDLLLNGIFSRWIWWWDGMIQAFNLTPAQLRTQLGVFNKRDFVGSIINGASVPISSGSATAFKILIWVPVALDNLFLDGNMFISGSKRLEDGQVQYNVGASLTPSIVLANGTAAVSGVGVDLKTEGGAGTEGDVGNTWVIDRLLGLPTTFQFDNRPIILLADILASSANGGTSITAQDFTNWSPSAFQAFFQQLTMPYGAGFDASARATYYLFPGPNAKASDLVARFAKGAPRLQIAAGVSSISVTQVSMEGVKPEIVQSVSHKVGGGGDVALIHITPHASPSGSKVPDAVAAFLPLRIVAKSEAPAGAQTVSAAGAATKANTNQRGRTVVASQGLRRRAS